MKKHMTKLREEILSRCHVGDEEDGENVDNKGGWWRIMLFSFKIIEYGVSWLRKLSELPIGH